MSVVKYHMDQSFAQRRNDILLSSSVRYVVETYCFLGRHQQWIPEFSRIKSNECVDNIETRWKDMKEVIISALKSKFPKSATKELELLGDLERLEGYSGMFLYLVHSCILPGTCFFFGCVCRCKGYFGSTSSWISISQKSQRKGMFGKPFSAGSSKLIATAWDFFHLTFPIGVMYC